METATLSDKFQVVIPKTLRDVLHLKPKQELAVWLEGDAISFTPLKKFKDPVAVMSSVSKKKHSIPIDALENEIEGMYS